MPRRCCVGGCGNVSSAKCTLHTFPKDTVIRDQWIRTIKYTGTAVSRGGSWNGPNRERTWNSQLVCADHFTLECFTLRTRLHWQQGLSYKACLEQDAVPTLFGKQIEEYRNREPVMRPAYRKREVERIITEYNASSDHTVTSSGTATMTYAESLQLQTETCVTELDGLTSLHVSPLLQDVHTLQPDDEVSVIQNQTKRRESISTCEKGAQVNIKEGSTDRQTSDKRCQTVTKHHTTVLSRGTQYTVNDYYEPHQIPKPVPRAEMASTPLKAGAPTFHFDSPGLNTTRSSLATDIGGDDDPDYVPDESNVSDDHEPELERKGAHEERKFIVFEDNLLTLFRVCPRCQGSTTAEVTNVIGTFVTVGQECSCGYERKWNSQPMFGTMPAGNILLSASLLFAGCSPTKVLRMFTFFNVMCISMETFFKHQRKFLWPTIENVWTSAKTTLQATIRDRRQPIIVSGDGRADSPGHCAKYGAYSLIEMISGKVIDVQLVQSNEVKSSYHMELEGLKRAISTLRDAGIAVGELITDRHPQIQKWVRENLLSTKHSFDVWHIAKGIKKKLLATAKEKDCDVVYRWIKSITNHIYWAACSSTDGEMIVAKWRSVVNHIQNVHTNHGGLFNTCQHKTLTDREWLKPGSKACSKLEVMLLKTRLCNDVKKMSTGFQTSTLESFHSVINQFAPKMTVYSFHGQLCRQHLAAMHFNENVLRGTATTKDGQPQLKISFPKYKSGDDYSVKFSSEKMTFAYVDQLLCNVVQVCDGEGTDSIVMSTPAPPPLTSGKNRPTKEEALAVITARVKKTKKELEKQFT